MNLAQLFKPVEQIVGLEITQGMLLAVLTERAPSGTITIRQKKAALPAGIISGCTILDRQGLSSALKQFARTNKDVFRSRYVILSLPSASLYTDVIQFPPLSPEQIAESLALNLKSSALFPFTIETVYYDWQPAHAETPAHNNALVGMGRRVDMNAFVDVCEQAGLEPVAFEPPQLSITRAISNFSKSLGMIIRLLDEGIEFSIIEAGELRFGRYVRMSATLTTLDAFKMFVADETTKMRSYYHAEHPDKQIVSVLILSSFTQKTEIASYLSEQLKVTTEALTTAHGFELKDDYVAACGAALRGLVPREEDTFISLMPVGTEETYRSRRFRAYISLWADIINTTSVALVLIFLVVYVWLGRVLDTTSATTLERTSAPAVQEEIARFENSVQRFNTLAAQLAPLNAKIVPWSRIIEEIRPTLIFPGITIEKISALNPQSITVAIRAETRDAAISFKKALETHERYERIDMPFLSVIQRDNVQTNITLVLKP